MKSTRKISTTITIGGRTNIKKTNYTHKHVDNTMAIQSNIIVTDADNYKD